MTIQPLEQVATTKRRKSRPSTTGNRNPARHRGITLRQDPLDPGPVPLPEPLETTKPGL